MKVIREQLIEAAKYTDFSSKYNISAFNEKTIFLVCLHCLGTADLRSNCGFFLAISQSCYAEFLFDTFDFSSDFYALDFLSFA